MARKYKKSALIIFLLPFCLLINISSAQLHSNSISLSSPLNIPVKKIVIRPEPYSNFCNRNPVECANNGSSIIDLTPEVMTLIFKVNSQVNNEIFFALDIDQYNREEFWALPVSGFGDCEDIALEKRSRLVELGYPIPAMRIAIVSHKRLLHSHALLSIETNKGTFLLNTFTDKVLPWTHTPYNFESRERADGLWERFDQSIWTYDP